jgi:hypothetical protein
MGKRGQGVFGMSFGMIFSILIIIAILALAVYVIIYFLNINKCGQIGVFYDGLQDGVNNAYGGSITRELYVEKVPSGIELVCFGNISNGFTRQPIEEERKAYDFINLYREDNANLYFYPESAACDGDLAYLVLEHVQTERDRFFCVKPVDGEVKLRLSKDSTDSLVFLCEEDDKECGK